VTRGDSLPRVATVGFQGFGNIGDEAILSGIEALLRDRNLHVTVVFSGPMPASISAFPDAERVLSGRHLPTPRALRALRRVDLMILAGGGLFNDHWIGVIPRYVAWTLAARFAGARVAWIGVGIGPISRRWLRWLMRVGARFATLVTVRDPASAAVIGAGARPLIVPDPSLFNDPPERALQGGLGFIIRAPTRRDAGQESRLADVFVEMIGSVCESDTLPVLMTMGGPADAAFADRLRRAIAGAGLPSPGIEPLGPTPAAALARISGLSGVITVRLHGLLLSALAGVPVVPIAYDEKVRAAAEQLGLEDLVVSLPEITAPMLLARLAAAGSEDRRSEVARRVVIMRDGQGQLADAIVAVATRP
jgi:polysaccharide pyruvyl transferase WcaK-like protein